MEKSPSLNETLCICATLALISGGVGLYTVWDNGYLFQSVASFFLSILILVLVSVVIFLGLFACATLFNAGANLAGKAGKIILQTAYPEEKHNQK